MHLELGRRDGDPGDHRLQGASRASVAPTYAAAGVYTETLVVNDGDGGVVSSMVELTARDNPVTVTMSPLLAVEAVAVPGADGGEGVARAVEDGAVANGRVQGHHGLGAGRSFRRKGTWTRLDA